jgi:hypothetical protein
MKTEGKSTVRQSFDAYGVSVYYMTVGEMDLARNSSFFVQKPRQPRANDKKKDKLIEKESPSLVRKVCSYTHGV